MAEPKLKPLSERYYKGSTLVEELKKGNQVRIGSQVGVRYTISYMQREKRVTIDSNVGKSEPFRFKFGFVDVIDGWDFALCGMFVGGKRRITIPSSVGRGTASAPWNKGRTFIPRDSDLVIDVEVVRIDC